jgi:Type IV leader peptidase family.
VSTFTDVRKSKIKNNLTYPLILLGLIVNTYQFGISGASSALTGIIIAYFVVSMLPGFRHGGGDIKLAMGIGAFVGSAYILYFLFIWFVLSLFICNLKIIKNKGFRYFKSLILNELLTLADKKTEVNERIIGAPVMLLGYLITLSLTGMWNIWNISL